MNAARRRCQASSVLAAGSSPRRRRQPPLAEAALAGLKNSVPDPHHHNMHTGRKADHGDGQPVLARVPQRDQQR
jgi:hypothetical protein